MMGSKAREQARETLTTAVKSAGALTTAALAVAGVALLIAVVALAVVMKRA